MSTYSIHLNVQSYVYFNTHQNISCSLLHLLSFKGFCERMYINLKEVKSKYRLTADNHYVLCT